MNTQNLSKYFQTGSKNYSYPNGTHNEHLVRNFTFKLKIFSVHRKKEKRELRDEKEEISRTLYKCPYCEKTYTNVTRYEVHLRTHTGEKPFSCSYCSKKFNEKGNLKAHLRIHTGERPFKCGYPGCVMSFKTRGQLKDHENRHSNLRPFKCYICGNSFNRKTRLKVHIMIHTGEKPFKCSFPDCGKTFREKGHLNSHLKKHLGTTTDIKPVQDLEKTGSTGEDIKDSNKSTTSYYNDVNDIIDRLCGDSKETVQKEDDELSLNELNVYYPTAEILLDNKQEENFN